MRKKLIFGTSVVVIILAASAVVHLNYLFEDACSNRIFDEVVSPGKKYTAVAFERNCGASTGFSTQISILNYNDALGNNSGDTYITNGQPEDVDLKMQWTDDRELVIGIELNGKEFKAETNWGNNNPVKITYSAIGS